MAEFPTMPFYTDSYTGDTTHLTTIEHGAYVLLLITMWRAGGWLPYDDDMICRYTRLRKSQWNKMKPVIMDFMRIEGRMFTQGKLHDTLEAVRIKSNKAAQSARAKHRKYNKTRPANAASTQDERSAILNPDPYPEKGSSSSAHDARDPDPPIEIEEVPPKDAGGADPSQSTVPTEADIMAGLQSYNDAAYRNGLKAAVMPLDATRRQRLSDRIEAYGLDRWCEAMSLIDSNAFLRGEAVPGVQADLTYLLKPDTIPRILEGNYDERPKSSGKSAKGQSRGRGSPRGQHPSADDGPATSIAQVVARDRLREQEEAGRRGGTDHHDEQDPGFSSGLASGGVVIDAVAT